MYCKLCNKNFLKVKTFNNHIESCVQKTINFMNKTTDIKTCPLCGKKSETLYQNYAHMVEHEKFNKKLECEDCKKQFKYKKNLMKHIQECTGTKFTCEFCGEVKTTQKQYLDHVDKNHNINDGGDGDTSDEEESAFGNIFQIRKWQTSHKKTVVDILSHYKPYVKKILLKKLEKNSIRFSLNVFVLMKKIDRITGKETDVEAGFSSGMMVFVSINDFDEIYDNCTNKILTSFDTFAKQGSGLIYAYTKMLHLKITNHRLKGGCFVSLPKHMSSKHIINIKSENNNCFEVAVLCGLLWKKEKNITKTYKKYLGKKLNFDGCKNK